MRRAVVSGAVEELQENAVENLACIQIGGVG